MTTIEELQQHWAKRLEDDGFTLVYMQLESTKLKIVGARIPNMSPEEFKKVLKKAKKEVTPEMDISAFKVEVTDYLPDFIPGEPLFEKPEGFKGIDWSTMFTLV